MNRLLNLAFERLDSATRDQSMRVSNYSTMIARTMGVPLARVSSIALGGRFHEIGKLAIPDTILYKPAKLSPKEQAVLREYPLLGYEIMRQEQSVEEAADIVYSHRENFDGTGYPRGLKGEAIALGARIVAVADAVDMFISDRPHRSKLTINPARIQVCRWSNTAFDPTVVESFAGIADELWRRACSHSR